MSEKKEESKNIKTTNEKKNNTQDDKPKYTRSKRSNGKISQQGIMDLQDNLVNVELSRHSKVLAVPFTSTVPKDQQDKFTHAEHKTKFNNALKASNRAMKNEYKDTGHDPDPGYVVVTEISKNGTIHLHGTEVFNGNAVQNGHNFLRRLNFEVNKQYGLVKEGTQFKHAKDGDINKGLVDSSMPQGIMLERRYIDKKTDGDSDRHEYTEYTHVSFLPITSDRDHTCIDHRCDTSFMVSSICV